MSRGPAPRHCTSQDTRLLSRSSTPIPLSLDSTFSRPPGRWKCGLTSSHFKLTLAIHEDVVTILVLFLVCAPYGHWSRSTLKTLGPFRIFIIFGCSQAYDFPHFSIVDCPTVSQALNHAHLLDELLKSSCMGRPNGCGPRPKQHSLLCRTPRPSRCPSSPSHPGVA